MTPDFATLFPASDESELTPRNALLLWNALACRSDFLYDEVDMLGSAPIVAPDDWPFLSDLPRLTWRRDASWRRQVARAADDLRCDLESGDWEGPRCTAEEVVLYLAVREASGFDDSHEELLEGLPEHEHDFDWGGFMESAFQDWDFRLLYDPKFDGVEDPAFELNQLNGMASLHPDDWFEPFSDVTPRDPNRGFRR